MPDAVKSITVVLNPPTLIVGAVPPGQAVAEITVTVPDSTLNQQSITWSSSNPAVATVTANQNTATVTAVAPGSVQIRARIGTVEGVATLTVAAPAVRIDQAAENALKALPNGALFVLRGPTLDFPSRKDA